MRSDHIYARLRGGRRAPCDDMIPKLRSNGSAVGSAAHAAVSRRRNFEPPEKGGNLAQLPDWDGLFDEVAVARPQRPRGIAKQPEECFNRSSRLHLFQMFLCHTVASGQEHSLLLLLPRKGSNHCRGRSGDGHYGRSFCAPRPKHLGTTKCPPSSHSAFSKPTPLKPIVEDCGKPHRGLRKRDLP